MARSGGHEGGEAGGGRGGRTLQRLRALRPYAKGSLASGTRGCSGCRGSRSGSRALGGDPDEAEALRDQLLEFTDLAWAAAERKIAAGGDAVDALDDYEARVDAQLRARIETRDRESREAEPRPPAHRRATSPTSGTTSTATPRFLADEMRRIAEELVRMAADEER